MTLAEFATLVDAPPKWVLNTNAFLGIPANYTVEAAERLALVRLLYRDVGVTLPRALTIADESLAAPTGLPSVAGGIVRLDVDVPRLRATIATRLSQVTNLEPRRRPGRKPKRTTALAAARRHGLDISLLQSNLARRPAERLRQLDAMASFRSRVRRKP